MKRVLIFATSTLALGACSTMSFAPPSVNLDSPIDTRSASFANCQKAGGEGAGEIPESFTGAMQLIDNFMVGYRCSERSLADGRSKFEVPAFLLGATAALGQSFGISENASLGLGAGAIAMTQGNSYFAAQEKADYLNSAIDALTCIQLESVGIPGFQISDETNKNTNNKKSNTERANEQSSRYTVSVSVQKQYFRLIYGSLLSVERILARRLNHAGSAFDSSGIVAEIELLVRKEAEQSEDSGNLPPTFSAGGGGEYASDGGGFKLFDRELFADFTPNTNIDKVSPETSRQAINEAKDNVVLIEVKKLQPKLQKCVVKAKV